MGLPSRSTRAFRMLSLLMPPEVSSNFIIFSLSRHYEPKGSCITRFDRGLLDDTMCRTFVQAKRPLIIGCKRIYKLHPVPALKERASINRRASVQFAQMPAL